MSKYVYSTSFGREIAKPDFGEWFETMALINSLVMGIHIGGVKPYLNTTQNLNYIKELSRNVTIKDAFTIIGGGDSVFTLGLVGADRIVAVDTNPLARHIFYLKNAAFETLSYDEFYDFLFDLHSSDFLARGVFEDKVSLGFGSDYQEYARIWGDVFEKYDKDVLLERFIAPGSENATNPRSFIPYISNEDNYYMVKDRMQDVEIELYSCDAIDLMFSFLDERFDWVDISNILLFVFQIKCNNNVENFREYLFKLKYCIKKILGVNGEFIIDYIFGKSDLNQFLSMKDCTVNDILDVTLRNSTNIYCCTVKAISEMFDIDVYQCISSGARLAANAKHDCVVRARVK